jgi:hypothetical protein
VSRKNVEVLKNKFLSLSHAILHSPKRGLIRIRRMLLDNVPYRMRGVAAPSEPFLSPPCEFSLKGKPPWGNITLRICVKNRSPKAIP